MNDAQKRKRQLEIISQMAQLETELRSLGIVGVDPTGPVCKRCGRIEKPWHPDSSCHLFFPYDG